MTVRVADPGALVGFGSGSGKSSDLIYWVTKKLLQICTAILRICIRKVASFAVYNCGNFWVTQYYVLNLPFL